MDSGAQQAQEGAEETAGDVELAPGIRPGRAPRRPRPRWRRALRWLALVIVGLVVLIVLLLLTVLFTAAGTRFALMTGARVYDGMIPGRVSIERVE
ncbi:MAG: hypothetical protein KC468_31500, partial [Myxococcales bacterium]|nr:hypothetical protein [Myxococcales bacterium]